jgi:hypothetical protein
MIENTILSSANHEMTTDIDANLKEISKHFGTDVNERKFKLNLSMLPDLMEGNLTDKLVDITEKINELGPAKRLYAEISNLISLLLVIPASSATAERSFSRLRRLKTYLRSTVGEERLNHLLLLNVHQDQTDLIDLRDVARDFVSLNSMRRNVFGLIFSYSLEDCKWNLCMD